MHTMKYTLLIGILISINYYNSTAFEKKEKEIIVKQANYIYKFDLQGKLKYYESTNARKNNNPF